MLKKFATLGLSAALVLAPVAAFAQTPSPEASSTPAASEPMKPMKKKMKTPKKPMAHKTKTMKKKKMESPSPTPSAT